MTNPTQRRHWLVVALAMFTVAWGGNEFTPLLTMYRLDYGFSDVVVDAMLFAYVLGIIPALLLGGPLSDRFGRRALMVPAPVIAIAGSVILAVGADHAALLIGGRLLSGVSLGLAMAVGGSWLTELSTAPWDTRASTGAGPRRVAMALTAGFGVGAGVAGILAEWGPWPSVFPYVVHSALTLVAFVLLLRVPETRVNISAKARTTRLVDDLKIPSAGKKRFWFLIVPVAPWVFGAAASAYAILPSLMTERAASAPIAFSAFLCLVALGFGFGIQAFGRRIDKPGSARAIVTAFGLLIVALPLAALAACTLSFPIVVIAAAFLGMAYGMALVGGLLEVQRIATPDDLAGLNAVFYSLSYMGFAVPMMMAVGVTWVSYPVMFLAGTLAALFCLLLVVVGARGTSPRAVKANQAVASS
ncbi:MFS transporter [Hoyosella rhizosphaerae]|uniref:Major facilitator family transporter n=1 Tax=Hoyosella rhizosphaerae TaxID=1755582 RepID=A0A916XJ90_9ACTN|nr:MFS transporter [Hoyosella rhizosphaerae]MBN4925334.1 MFS transporter [Hoyosella rhizosphaerae]GGC76128.1 major facilitator family transporter [Hoyosella rhizosphaerae]